MKQEKHTNRNLQKIQQIIDSGHQPLYKLFNNERVGEILSDTLLVNTPYHGRTSQKSLQIPFLDRGLDLVLIFGLDHKAFGRKYLEAISGDGQEAKKIRTLHSSSLLCLLCFYGISKERPLILNLDGREVKFTDSSFEVKTPVGTDENGMIHESNMDVVLRGNDMATGKRVILFLESKFSEYLNWGAFRGISNYVYEKTYARLNNNHYLDRMGLKFANRPDNIGYSDLSSIHGRTLHYAGGIKQMISHYMGVKNSADRGTYDGYDIYLGEILYKFPESIDINGLKYKDYDSMYRILAEGLNSLSEDKVKILSRCLTYQDLFKSYDLDDSVRTFYSL